MRGGFGSGVRGELRLSSLQLGLQLGNETILHTACHFGCEALQHCHGLGLRGHNHVSLDARVGAAHCEEVLFGGERVQVLRAAIFVADNAARAQVFDAVIFDGAFRLDVRRFEVWEEHYRAAQPAIATGRHTIVHDP